MSSANRRMVRPGWREEAPIPGRSTATRRILPAGGRHPKRSCPKPAKKTMGWPSGGPYSAYPDLAVALELAGLQ